MQRQAYVPGLAALAAALVLGLTGCSSGGGSGTGAVDSKAGPAAAAPPGRYRTLFEPCGAVPQNTLRDLLPGAAQLPDEERIAVYRGTAAVTYDTDRRVGCSWKADTPDAMHRLRLDIERVVSYDPAVSDDGRAQEVFSRKQLAADLPQPPQPTSPPQSPTSPTSPASPSGSGSNAGDTGGGPTMSGSAQPGDPATQPPAQTPTGAPATGLEPRVLPGLGEVAFLDDALSAGGANGRHRTVSVVFRTSNVVVTVEYVEQTTGSADAPDSRELQEKALNLARLLAERLEG